MRKEKFLYILKKVIDWLTHYYNKNLKQVSGFSPYNALSPTDNAENIDYYIESLNWALLNRKKIKNIAISGPYGSGKSSVIETFQKRNLNREFNFLNISLATFKENKKENTKSSNEDLLRLIELSVLQQFFYHEKDHNIPDSRFKKIKSHSSWHLKFIAIGIIIFLTSLFYLVFPNILAKLSLFEIPLSYQKSVHIIAVLIFITGLLYILFKITRIIKSVVIKKLSINNASIEIDNTISKSILNNHLDEILYFFEVTKYNIVIIEDIDRFEQTEVFTKLRELNLLINNSKKTKENIVFIYAIRDNMFKDKDRTKFFDFMIPIIPVINSSNSNEKLLGIIKENKYKISNDLVSNISLFIDDMRLLFNIMNEYHIYSNSLSNNLNQDKLLSMIVYKNMHPIDFTKLSNNEGSLYETLAKRQLYVKEKLKENDKKISDLKEKITKYENSELNNITELRIIYLNKIIEKIRQLNVNQPFFNFFTNNKVLDVTQATEDENFNAIINSKNIQYTYNQNQGYRQNFILDFIKIEKEVNSEMSYSEREEALTKKERIDEFKILIEELEEQKSQFKKQKIKELLSNKLIQIENQESKQIELINILLRNGYIDEDYHDYISIFYEGSLSKSDYQFLINIKTQVNTEFDFKLNKIENLIDKINQSEFERTTILNFSLLDFLLTNNKHKVKRDLVLKQLYNVSEISVRFIDNYINFTANIKLFIKAICEKWHSIWKFIENESDFSEEKKDNYFRLIIEHANVKDIKEIFADSTSTISENSEFLELTTNQAKIKEIIRTLNIRFKDINVTSPKDLLEFIFLNNHYSINIKMLTIFLKFHEIYQNQDFNEKNYSAIQNSGIKNLIEYIENNINEYIGSVYLRIEPNNLEPINSLLSLLNNENVSIENKEKLISRSEFKIEEIADIENSNLVNLILKESKMLSNWKNIFSVYVENDFGFSNELVHFMNISDNFKELSKIKIDKEFPDEKIAKEFIRKIILNEDFNNDAYSNLLNSVPYIYTSLNFAQLSEQKVKLLIEHKTLVMNNENYLVLKNNFHEIHTSLIESNPAKFIKEIEDYEISDLNILSILKSQKLNVNQKVTFLKNYQVTTFNTDIVILNQIGELLITNLELDIHKDIINSIILKSELTDLNKIKIFTKYNDHFNKDEIENFILTLKKPYFNISKNGKRPLIDKGEANENFLKILVRKKYISKYETEKKGLRISTFKNK